MAKTTQTFTPPPPSRKIGPWVGLGSRARDFRDRVLESSFFWVLIFLAVGTWILAPGNLLESFDASAWQEGIIASKDYEAPVDLPIEDKETTLQKRRKAKEDVLPVYDFDPGLATETVQKFETLFAEGRRLIADAPDEVQEIAADDEAVRAALLEITDLKLKSEDITLLAARDFSPDLEDRLSSALSEVLLRGIVANKALLLENRVRGITLLDLRSGSETGHFDLYGHLGYPEEVRAFLTSEVRGWSGFSSKDRRQAVELLFANLVPNLNLNNSKTIARREDAAQGARAVFIQIRKGQILVRKGDQISATAAQAIAEIARRGSSRGRLLPVLGTLLLLLLSCLVLWSTFRTEKIVDRSRQRRFNEGLLLLVIGLLGSAFACLVGRALSEAMDTAPFQNLDSYLYGVPFAAVALVARLLYTRTTALTLSLVLSVLVTRLEPETGGWMMIYCLAGSLMAIAALDMVQVKQRLVLTRVGAMVGLTNLVLILIITSLSPGGLERGLGQVGFDLFCGFAGGLLAGAAASFALPILESLLCITSDIKLVELSNTNLPLLRRLAFEAPGTFQHSLMVANLAKAGCEAVGADAVLAYAGALYHDIGKMERPEYFIENQAPGRNPHDKLQPSMSALVITNHVKKGLSLAREYNLPQPLRDAIAQHHGTRRLNFFYKKAEERGDGEELRDEDYRYPGPRPRNRVMGILMLADGVEAASRTLVDPSDLKIRELVRKLVDACLQEGQLDDSDLTLAELRKASEAFQLILSSIYHRRIDYPGFEFNRRSKRETSVERGRPKTAGAARAS